MFTTFTFLVDASHPDEPNGSGNQCRRGLRAACRHPVGPISSWRPQPTVSPMSRTRPAIQPLARWLTRCARDAEQSGDFTKGNALGCETKGELLRVTVDLALQSLHPSASMSNVAGCVEKLTEAGWLHADGDDLNGDLVERRISASGNETACDIFDFVDATGVREAIDVWDADHPPFAFAFDLNLVGGDDVPSLSAMLLLILRTTPGEIVRWPSGTATDPPDGCAHWEWRPFLLPRVNPAALRR
jgi:hypothetical protein